MRIEQREDRLFMVAPKQPKYAMTFLGDHTFKLNLAKVKVVFTTDESGQITALDLSGWGDPQTYVKTGE